MTKISGIPIGIMQGRLVPHYNDRYQSFPLPYWKDEFQLAAKLGFNAIEFIFDIENFEDSPLITLQGHRDVRELKDCTGVSVYSVCADYFMRFPMFSDDALVAQYSEDMLMRLLENADLLGICDITIPCVDESSLKTVVQKDALRDAILRVLGRSAGSTVNVNLETDMGPSEFGQYVKEFDHPRIKVNYDIGNSAALGYNPDEELSEYGKHVSVLHIKDRLLNDGSVKLGSGNANFKKVFTKLKNDDFNGIIIMQAARAATYDEELAFVAEQFTFLNSCLKRWFN